jgi:hypothetical protein
MRVKGRCTPGCPTTLLCRGNVSCGSLACSAWEAWHKSNTSMCLYHQLGCAWLTLSASCCGHKRFLCVDVYQGCGLVPVYKQMCESWGVGPSSCMCDGVLCVLRSTGVASDVVDPQLLLHACSGLVNAHSPRRLLTHKQHVDCAGTLQHRQQPRAERGSNCKTFPPIE